MYQVQNYQMIGAELKLHILNNKLKRVYIIRKIGS